MRICQPRQEFGNTTAVQGSTHLVVQECPNPMACRKAVAVVVRLQFKLQHGGFGTRCEWLRDEGQDVLGWRKGLVRRWGVRKAHLRRGFHVRQQPRPQFKVNGLRLQPPRRHRTKVCWQERRCARVGRTIGEYGVLSGEQIGPHRPRCSLAARKMASAGRGQPAANEQWPDSWTGAG